MKTTSDQLRAHRAGLDVAAEAYRHHRDGFDRFSPNEQQRRADAARAAYEQQLRQARELAAAAQAEAQAEVERSARWPDATDVTEVLTTASERRDAADRRAFVREDAERLAPELLAARLGQAASSHDRVGRWLHARYASQRLAAPDADAGPPDARLGAAVGAVRERLVTLDDIRAKADAEAVLAAVGDSDA
jgi:hypothetical protein